MADDTRNRILDAAEHLIARLGYQKTTVDDIAAEARISKRTIYLHFPSKEEIALVTIDRIAERLNERLRALSRVNGSPAARLREMLCERVMFRFDSVHEYRGGIDESVRSLRPGLLARRACHFDAEARILAEVLAEGRATSEFTGGDDVATAHAMILATNALLPASLSPSELEERTEIEAWALRIIDLLLGGVLAKGLARTARRFLDGTRRRAALPS
ncbi:MAG TPA: helix-turn-helix domain-containing protein [Gemmataceae bacterium]|nr:helix-turn-helix domain-containing protein [Gemmataceae bacterium]